MKPYLIGAMMLGAMLMTQSAEAQLANRKVMTLAAAETALAAAKAEAIKNNWNVAIAVVDDAGNLLAFSKLDNTQVASVDIAIGKARTAVRFKRPTKALEDAVAGGRNVLLAVEGITPLEGGVPIMADGVIIGAVGVSGVMSSQDAMVAQAGVSTVK